VAETTINAHTCEDGRDPDFDPDPDPDFDADFDADVNEPNSAPELGPCQMLMGESFL